MGRNVTIGLGTLIIIIILVALLFCSDCAP